MIEGSERIGLTFMFCNWNKLLSASATKSRRCRDILQCNVRRSLRSFPLLKLPRAFTWGRVSFDLYTVFKALEFKTRWHRSWNSSFPGRMKCEILNSQEKFSLFFSTSEPNPSRRKSIFEPRRSAGRREAFVVHAHGSTLKFSATQLKSKGRRSLGTNDSRLFIVGHCFLRM